MKYSIDYNGEVKGKFKKRKDAIVDVQEFAFLLKKNGARLSNQRLGSFDYRVQLADGNMSDRRTIKIIKW